MLKKTHSQDFSYEFEVVFDKHKETTLQKIKRWISKRKPPLNTILMYLFSYVELWYWEGKLKQTMSDVDNQTEEILKEWEQDAEKYYERPIVEEGHSSVPDLPTLRIRNPVVERGTEEPSTSMAPTGAKIPFPDPWEGDWNDGVYIWQQINKERSL